MEPFSQSLWCLGSRSRPGASRGQACFSSSPAWELPGLCLCWAECDTVLDCVTPCAVQCVTLSWTVCDTLSCAVCVCSVFCTAHGTPCPVQSPCVTSCTACVHRVLYNPWNSMSCPSCVLHVHHVLSIPVLHVHHVLSIPVLHVHHVLSIPIFHPLSIPVPHVFSIPVPRVLPGSPGVTPELRLLLQSPSTQGPVEDKGSLQSRLGGVIGNLELAQVLTFNSLYSRCCSILSFRTTNFWGSPGVFTEQVCSVKLKDHVATLYKNHLAKQRPFFFLWLGTFETIPNIPVILAFIICVSRDSDALEM
ncbi:uncharacterized protein LOC115947658 [Geospiza fortis]|uniref:Uncharacterized protein LOC115947658 n=1 Tax=Geospiza fortis TaxID=48883 RepID=A0A8N5EI63_GEOFO|nr:uncharacterized protein LOC115947658 [Geospiza fortis]